MLARLVTESDEQAVVDLARQAVADHGRHPFSEQKVRSHFWQSLGAADPTIFVVETAVGVVGFVAARLSDFPYATGLFVVIEVLYVRPDKRGTRAAALLVQTVTAWADRVGALETFAGPTVEYRVAQTSRLFRRYGFKPVGCALRRARSA